MKEQFINRYPLSKTLRFSLIPVGETENNFNKNLLLEKDKQRAENYEKVKGYIDRFHKEYIESVLSKARIEKVDEYANFSFIYSILYNPCIFKAYRLLNVQT